MFTDMLHTIENIFLFAVIFPYFPERVRGKLQTISVTLIKILTQKELQSANISHQSLNRSSQSTLIFHRQNKAVLIMEHHYLPSI